MKRKEVINFFVGVMMSVLICFSALLGVYCFSEQKTGTAADVITEKNDIERKIAKAYSKYSNVTVSAGSETKVNCNNHNQTKLREYFNKHNGDRTDIAEGICWASATTSLLEFYKASKKSSNVICFDVIDMAERNSYVVYGTDGKVFYDDGFTHDNQDNLITKMFKKYSMDKKGNNDYYNIYKTLTKEIDSGRAVIFSIKGHTMTGSGYVTYKVKYFKKNLLGKKVSVTEELNYVIVNDTWAENRDRQYSYFPENKIGTGISTRWNFGITKVRNK